MDISAVLNKKIRFKIENSATLKNLYSKFENGTATYNEATSFGKHLGELMADSIQELNLDGVNFSEFADDVVGKLLYENYSVNSTICKRVQTILNRAAGTEMNPVEPKVNVSRGEGLKELIKQAETEEQVKQILDEPLVNYSMANVDDWIKTNYNFQGRAGMQPIIARKYEGAHWDPHRGKGGAFVNCKYCQSLAGSWDYGDEPYDVFKRHEGCRCTVVYYPNKKAKGVITALAKGEKDTNKVLYNTGQYTSTTRRAVLEQRKKMYGKEEARRMLNDDWKGGLNGLAERHFS